MGPGGLPGWERRMLEEAMLQAEERIRTETARAELRARQLAREQAYHRLALAIDRPREPAATPGQLRLWPVEATLFEGEVS